MSEAPPTVSTTPSHIPFSNNLLSPSNSFLLIIFFAPKFFKYSSLSFLPVTACTSYPILDNIITAILPTPPVAPVTKTSFTLVPNSSSSFAFTAKEQSNAVKPAVPSIIDFLLSRSLGILIKKFESTFAYCEKPPK